MVKTIEFKDAACVYRTEGKGKVLMLVHGFMEEGSMWNDMIKDMKDEYRFIIPDLPGFGQSALPEGKMSMELYAELLKAICTQEKVKSFILLGHSMGGYIALSFAEKYPKLLSGLGLLNSHCYEDPAEKKANRKKTIDFIKKNGTKTFVKEFYDSIFEPAYKKKHFQIVKAMRENALKYTPEAVIAATEAMMNRKDKSAVLSKAEVPVLLINGKQDAVVSPENALKQASLAKVTAFYMFDKAKHMSMFEKKKETIAAIREFVDLCE